MSLNLGAGNAGNINVGWQLRRQQLGWVNVGPATFWFGNIGAGNFDSATGPDRGRGGAWAMWGWARRQRQLGLARGVHYRRPTPAPATSGSGQTGDYRPIMARTRATGNLGLFNPGTGNMFAPSPGPTRAVQPGQLQHCVGRARPCHRRLQRETSTPSGQPAPTTPAASTWAASTSASTRAITGWFNTGHTNTGLFTGNVNTGAFNSGSFNNGALWTGDYTGWSASPSASTSPAPCAGTLNETQPGPHRVIDIPGMSRCLTSTKCRDPSPSRRSMFPRYREDPRIGSAGSHRPGARHHNSRTDENHSAGHPASPVKSRRPAFISMRFGKARTGSSGRPRRFPISSTPGAHQSILFTPGPGPRNDRRAQDIHSGFRDSANRYHEIPVDVNISGGPSAFTCSRVFT